MTVLHFVLMLAEVMCLHFCFYNCIKYSVSCICFFPFFIPGLKNTCGTQVQSGCPLSTDMLIHLCDGQPKIRGMLLQTTNNICFTMWKLQKFTFTCKILRESNLHCNSVRTALISRNFCVKMMRDLFSIFTL